MEHGRLFRSLIRGRLSLAREGAILWLLSGMGMGRIMYNQPIPWGGSWLYDWLNLVWGMGSPWLGSLPRNK